MKEDIILNRGKSIGDLIQEVFYCGMYIGKIDQIIKGKDYSETARLAALNQRENYLKSFKKSKNELFILINKLEDNNDSK